MYFQELITEQENILITMEGVNTAADDLCLKLECKMQDNIHKENKSLHATIGQQGNRLHYRRRELEDLFKFIENYDFNSAKAKARLQSSIQTCDIHPNLYKDISAKLQKTQVCIYFFKVLTNAAFFRKCT